MKPFSIDRRIYVRGEYLGELLLKPFQLFASIESAGGILMLAMTVIALIWMNSPLDRLYRELWETGIAIGLNGWLFQRSLHFWINEGLMTLFFFVVGLEIKREILVGELASFQKAALPVAGAIGGMVVPALIYVAFNHADAAYRGWGIPMATDIAFVAGTLILLGSRVPPPLSVFLVSLAIVDDLGAVVVIALFYSSGISMGFLGLAGAVLGALIVTNILGFRSPLPYILLGLLLWLCVYLSGVHATVAGVLVAMTIPARSACDTHAFAQTVNRAVGEFRPQGEKGWLVLLDEGNEAAVRTLGSMVQCVRTPLHKIEEALHPWTVFLILPVFALANAGVNLTQIGFYDFVTNSESIGIVLGLFLGKQLGITAASWLAVKAGLAAMPSNVKFRHVYGGAILCGIGFTMSLFIADLSFSEVELLERAKISILVGSMISGLVGGAALYLFTRNR
ncbi:MAG: Na+/H+ antiporter NhaA [Desulfomonile tiedjei]|nr:Na+/H+ antiporter NhaA [Desulfomonile tiedjei]